MYFIVIRVNYRYFKFREKMFLNMFLNKIKSKIIYFTSTFMKVMCFLRYVYSEFYNYLIATGETHLEYSTTEINRGLIISDFY